MWRVELIDASVISELDSRLDAATKNYASAKTQQNANELDAITEFIDKLCAFIGLKSVTSPDVHLQKLYEPQMFAALVDYRSLRHLQWNAFFRLDQSQPSLKVVCVKHDNDAPVVGLKSFLDSF